MYKVITNLHTSETSLFSLEQIFILVFVDNKRTKNLNWR